MCSIRFVTVIESVCGNPQAVSQIRLHFLTCVARLNQMNSITQCQSGTPRTHRDGIDHLTRRKASALSYIFTSLERRHPLSRTCLTSTLYRPCTPLFRRCHFFWQQARPIFSQSCAPSTGSGCGIQYNLYMFTELGCILAIFSCGLNGSSTSVNLHNPAVPITLSSKANLDEQEPC